MYNTYNTQGVGNRFGKGSRETYIFLIVFP